MTYGLCAWCCRIIRVKKNGRLRVHDELDNPTACLGIDELPETNPERVAIMHLRNQHRYDEYHFCGTCSKGKPAGEWVKWPCPTRTEADFAWKRTIPQKASQETS